MSIAVPTFTRHVLVVLALVALAAFVWKIAPVLMLGFAGIVFAVVVRAASRPLARRLDLHPTLAVSVIFVCLLALLIGAGYLFGKQITEQAEQLYQALNEAGDKVEARLRSTPLGASAMDQLRGGADPEAMKRVAKGTVTVFGAVADVALVLFLALYFAVDPLTYRNGMLMLVPEGARARVANALDDAGVALRQWLVGQLGAMVLVGVLTAIGLWAIGLPLAIPLGVLSGILDFVPVIGPLVAALPGILIAFGQGPEVALYAALVYLAVQFVEGNIVLPLAQKWAVSLPPALGLLGIVAFGMVFGLMGLLFAMPLLVVVVTLVNRLYVEKINGP